MDRPVKIKIVVRGPRSSITGGAGTGKRRGRASPAEEVGAPAKARPVRPLFGIAAIAVTAMIFGGWWLSSGGRDAEPLAPAVSESPSVSTPASLPISSSDESATPETDLKSVEPTVPVKITTIVKPGTAEFAELSGDPLPVDMEQTAAQTDTESAPADPVEATPQPAERSSKDSTGRDPFVQYLRRRDDSADSDAPKVGQEPPPATAPPPPKTPPAAADGPVRRAQFTTAMRNREPVDELGSDFAIWPEDPDRLYFFTELRDLAGNSITHKWLRNGKLMATINFEVRGPRWRVYSSKLITASMKGEWSVRVEDASGNLLRSGHFRVTPD